MTATVYEIRWHRNLERSYRYGTNIKFSGAKVEFSNTLMTPGTAIRRWSSKANYSQHHEVPELPLLLGGHTYSVAFDGAMTPEESVHTRVRFYDENDEQLSHVVFKSGSGTFEYPPQARNYEISLLNMNNEQLTFKKFTLARADILPRYRVIVVDPHLVIHVVTAMPQVAKSAPWQIRFSAWENATASRVLSANERNNYADIELDINLINQLDTANQIVMADMLLKQLSEAENFRVAELLIDANIYQKGRAWFDLFQTRLQEMRKQS